MVMNTTDPKQALEEFIGEQFIEWLGNHVRHEFNSWPIVTKIKEAKPKPEKLKKFILQIFLVNEAFLGGREGDPGFLRFAIANLSESNDPQAENALELLEKRRSEELMGHKIERGITQTVSRQQWIRLLLPLGLTEDEIDGQEPKEPTRNYIAELSEVYSTGEWQTAIGAFAAQEICVVEEYKVILEFLKNNQQLSDKDLQVLTDRITHGSTYITASNHALDKIVFDQEAKDLVWQGVSRQMEIHKEFLNGLEKYLES
jgi:hypothetical protein